jgi:hypothetical protein
MPLASKDRFSLMQRDDVTTYLSDPLTNRKMKIIFTWAACAVISMAASAQSKSFEALRERFRGEEDVYAFSASGWLCRSVISVALKAEDGDEPELRLLKKAMRDIDHVRFITVPAREFAAQGVSVKGFRSFLLKDQFEVLADVRDKGDHVTFYQRMDDSRQGHYFVLIEEPSEVVAIEMKGYIDPSIFDGMSTQLTYQNN